MSQDTQEVLFSFEANSSIMWSLIFLSGSIRWWVFLIKVQYSWEFLFPTNWLRNTLLLRFENNLFHWQDEKFYQTDSDIDCLFHFSFFVLFSFLLLCFCKLKPCCLKNILSFSPDLQIAECGEKLLLPSSSTDWKDVLINFKKLDFLAMMTRTL